MAHDGGYEKCAHLYDLFDTKENIEFFLRYVSEAGEILDIGAGGTHFSPSLPRLWRVLETNDDASEDTSQNHHNFNGKKDSSTVYGRIYDAYTETPLEGDQGSLWGTPPGVQRKQPSVYGESVFKSQNSDQLTKRSRK